MIHQRILVPLDGTHRAEQALPWAETFAVALGASVDLVRAVDPSPLTALTESLTNQETTERSTEDALLSLRASRAKLALVEDVELTVAQGPVSEVILNQVQKRQASLIIMSSHGREGMGRAFIGSITGDTISQIGLPVLVIPPDAETTTHIPSTVLVPYDGSELAASIFRHAVSIARTFAATVVLFRVVDLPPATLAVQGATIPLGPTPHLAPAEAIEDLDQAAETLRHKGVEVETRVGSGDRVLAILQAADETKADLIAMSTHGRRGLGRLLMGSVAEGVMQAAEVPVLAFQPAV